MLPFCTKRIVLVDSVSEILSRKNLLINPSTTDLVNIYLYGNPELDEYKNKLVLLATIKFITDSNSNCVIFYSIISSVDAPAHGKMVINFTPIVKDFSSKLRKRRNFSEKTDKYTTRKSKC